MLGTPPFSTSGAPRVDGSRLVGYAPGVAQRGAALIVALVVVAVVAVLAVSAASDFQLLARRVEHELHSDQAYAYLLGMEGLARTVLLSDLTATDGAGKDSAAELWAQPIELPTDRGSISGQLHDLQARFNLNSLGGSVAAPGAATAGVRYSAAQERFIRLLQVLPLDQPLALAEAQRLTEAITDWIDPDDVPSGPGGAETDWYSRVEPAGRSANRPLAAPSELLWVRGVTPAIYRALAPLVTVWLPAEARTNVNVPVTFETIEDPARAQAARLLLASLHRRGELAPQSSAVIETLLRRLVLAGGFDSLAALELPEVDVTGLGVTSDTFLLVSTTQYAGRHYRLETVLQRDRTLATVRVLARSSGDW